MLNVAVVESAAPSANVTVPGPLTLLHVVTRTPGGTGKPSSETEPTRFARAGRTTPWSLPALTTGASFVTEVVSGTIARLCPPPAAPPNTPLNPVPEQNG